jgi:adenylate cyclase
MKPTTAFPELPTEFGAGLICWRTNMLKRIKYVSQFAKALGNEDIKKLAKAASNKNKKLGVTGVLMASGELFFQIIEGPADVIDQLYETICRDQRHKNVFKIEEVMAKSRLFPKWSMKKLDLDSSAEARLEPLRLLLQVAVDQKHQLLEITESLGRLLWHEVVNVGLPE